MIRRGFVDVQVNGYMGTSFSKRGLTVPEVRQVCTQLVERGTIALCPTVTTSPIDRYEQNLPVLVDALKDEEVGEHILGFHIEGPFISPEDGARGAHPLDHVIEPTVELFDRMQEWADGNIAILTLDPARPGAEDLIRHASKQGVVVALGHHFAPAAAMAAAVKAGAQSATHLGNGIQNMIHRHHNPIWWQLACDELWGTFITDGQHLPPEFIKVALRAKTPARSVVVSDSAGIAGLPPGEYGNSVITETGRINCKGTEYLAGSNATMLDCMNYLASLGILDEDELWQIGFENPLRLLGKDTDAVDKVRAWNVVYADNCFRVTGTSP